MGETTTPGLDVEIEEEISVAGSWQVVLLDDDDHTYHYVIEMLHRLFGHPLDLAYKMTVEVDTTGRVIVDVGSREQAEDGRDRIHGFGADWRLARSKGPMSAVVEPIE